VELGAIDPKTGELDLFYTAVYIPASHEWWWRCW